MSSVSKVSNFLGDKKEELFPTLLLEKKSLKNDVDKGTDELVDTPLLEKKSSTKYVDTDTDELADKKIVVTIRRKGFNKFEGQFKGSTGWFKLYSKKI